MTNMRKSHPLIKIISHSFIHLPTTSNISTSWNFGSLLGICLGLQIVTGRFLAMHNTTDTNSAFSSLAHIGQDVNYGWLIQHLHANGASMFFISLHLHIGHGIYCGSYMLAESWNISLLLFSVTATALMGYVLPWGQMSFWGATVVTNFSSALPYIHPTLVEWIWGGFSVDNASLMQVFAFHFILPFSITALVMIHLLFLHESGSNNPSGFNSESDKIPFYPCYTTKDFMGFLFMGLTLISRVLFSPDLLWEPDDYTPANPLNTPPHIKPECFFLFTHTSLGSIPNKLGGVVALMLSVLMLTQFPMPTFQNNEAYTSGP